MNDFKQTMQQYKQAVETYLDGCFSDSTLPQKRLFEAMRYSLLAGGKRIRPILVLEFCRLCGGQWEKAMPFAAAVEMVHTYSLIHDDLPCMDDDDYRRGRLTNHKVYGEASAVLAGDALLTAAFAAICSSDLDPKMIVKAVQTLSVSAGERGMVGGQVLDIDGENLILDANQVHDIHRMKTGALICAACCMGAIAANATDAQMQAAKTYAQSIGLAFQIRDDMLDVIGDAKTLGKATNMDQNKNTFVSLFGLDTCQAMVHEQTNRAISALSCFEDPWFLTELASMLAIRDY